MKLVPRDVVWPGQVPTNSSGSKRPLMALNAPYLTIHYTGGGLWLDKDDTPAELRSIQDYALSAGKPWEYNYVIDGQGVVWEYAGAYQAAHSGGENEIAIGVLLLIGLSSPSTYSGWEIPPEEMIEATRELRVWLMEKGYLATVHEMLQHNQMPGAATACPGQAVIDRWYQFLAPPSEEGDDEMGSLRFVRHTGYINVFMVGAGPALSIPGELMNSYPADTPRVFVSPANPQSLKAMCFQSGLNMNDEKELTPGGPLDQF